MCIADRLCSFARNNANTLQYDLRRLERTLKYNLKHSLGAFAKSLQASAAEDDAPRNANVIAAGKRVAACIKRLGGRKGGEEWILGTVASFKEKLGTATSISVADFDNSENIHTIQDAKKDLHLLPEVEDVAGARRRLPAPGNTVWALYPDTTSFYKATLIEAPFRAARMDSKIFMNRIACVVTFFGDEKDEDGELPRYLVGAEYVFLL